MGSIRNTIVKTLLGVGIVTLMLHWTPASAVTIKDLVGRWCGDKTNYTFSRTEMIVTPVGNWRLNHPPHWTILKTTGHGRQIDVYWAPDRPGNFTSFELANKRTLIQLPQTEGDKGPRR